VKLEGMHFVYKRVRMVGLHMHNILKHFTVFKLFWVFTVRFQ